MLRFSKYFGQSSSVLQFLVIILLCHNFSIENVSCFVQPNYTNQEKTALGKFRELVSDAINKDYMKSDPYLIRWIRAQNFNLDAANRMLREAMKWRKENRIDGILDESIYEFRSPPYYDDGVDFEGNSVVVLLPGRVEMRNLILNGKRPQAIRFWDQLLETLEMRSLLSHGILGNSSTSIGTGIATVIMDMHGFSFRQHACLTCLGVYGEWFRHMEKYYPGYSAHFIIINAPRTALPAIELVKSIMSPETMKMFQAFGANRNDWLPVIRKLIPVDQVRANLGGTKTD